ncbi:DUF6471 domain-containing protein [Thiobacillus sp.]|uniref:DUF6471 domain-containing protein n=1 Tax=Thiobacillus sp. TaxID=924 RepID=UPI0025D5AFC1|nr:DUF6471 domain-containing protein [Thiobacillus sp.]MBT9538306.1 hypothetical protein [Thiobacillus sp.]
MNPPVDWKQEARRLLRAQLALKDVTYKGLSRALLSVGVDENPKALANKIIRGTFSFSFFLQCMRALDVDVVRLRDREAERHP